MNVYAHVMPSLMQESADAMDRALGHQDLKPTSQSGSPTIVTVAIADRGRWWKYLLVAVASVLVYVAVSYEINVNSGSSTLKKPHYVLESARIFACSIVTTVPEDQLANPGSSRTENCPVTATLRNDGESPDPQSPPSLDLEAVANVLPHVFCTDRVLLYIPAGGTRDFKCMLSVDAVGGVRIDTSRSPTLDVIY